MLTSFCEKSTQKLACYFDVTNKEKDMRIEPACDEVTELWGDARLIISAAGGVIKGVTQTPPRFEAVPWVWPWSGCALQANPSVFSLEKNGSPELLRQVEEKNSSVQTR